jgi:hypothetical protein
MEVVRRSALKIAAWLFSRENLLALGLCLAVILLLIATAGVAPRWIYQGF